MRWELCIFLASLNHTVQLTCQYRKFSFSYGCPQGFLFLYFIDNDCCLWVASFFVNQNPPSCQILCSSDIQNSCGLGNQVSRSCLSPTGIQKVGRVLPKSHGLPWAQRTPDHTLVKFRRNTKAGKSVSWVWIPALRIHSILPHPPWNMLYN